MLENASCLFCKYLQYGSHHRKVSPQSWHWHAVSLASIPARPIEPPPNPYYLCPAPSSKPILKRRPKRDLWPHGPKTWSELRSISWLRFYIRRMSLWCEFVKPIVGLKTKRAMPSLYPDTRTHSTRDIKLKGNGWPTMLGESFSENFVWTLTSKLMRLIMAQECG